MEISRIPIEGRWSEVSGVINSNFTTIKNELTNFEKDRTLALGLFSSLEELQATYPRPVVGSWAYIGTSFPAAIWEYTSASGWQNTGATGNITVELNEFSSAVVINDARDILSDYNN